MNDFTKEELLILKDAIQIYFRTPSPIEAEQLRDKLYSIIDNYCEHEFTEWVSPVQEDKIHVCMSCKRYL
jgi:hypothetical protein